MVKIKKENILISDNFNIFDYIDFDYTEEDILHFNNSKYILINNQYDLINYIKASINDYHSIKLKAIIWRIPSYIVHKIKESINKDFTNFSFVYDKDNIRHIFSRHIKNEKENIPLNYEELLLFPYILCFYDEIDIYEAKNILIARKWIKNRYQLIIEFSYKTKSIVLKTMYKIKKER